MRPALALAFSLVCVGSLAACGSGDSGSGPADGAGGDSPVGDGSSGGGDGGTGDDAASGGDARGDAIADAAMDAPSKPACSSMPNAVGTTHRMAQGNPYVAYVPPSYDKSKSYSLVVALHGAGDTAGNYLSIIWQGNADSQGFLVIAPEGTSPLGSGYTWDTTDEPLILAAIDDVYACYAIDPKKIILHGFSAGAIMSYWIGLKDAKRFSGISIASADLGSAEAVNGGPLLPAPWKIPVSHFHGMQDMNFPIMYAIAGMNRLIAAGHPFYWHPFNGGHTTNPADALQMYMDLKSSTAP
jgi:poly(3-hydroxybutyrate) depolymerase